MSMYTVLVVVLVLMLLGGLPRWGYSTNWGYGPSGLIGILLVVLVLYMLLGGNRGLTP